MTTSAEPSTPPAALSAAAFMSSVERFTIGPMLVAIAAGLDVPLGAAVAAASTYFLAYGLSQPLWGILSDRYGRVRLIRLALLAGGLASIASGLVPNLAALVVVRTVAGAFFGAVVPTSLTYVGDTVPVVHRQRALSDLMAAMAVGTALATALAGLGAEHLSWRVVFFASGAAALVIGVLLRRLSEPDRPAAPARLRPQLSAALSHPWARLIYLLVFVEGGILLGMLTLLPPALSSRGVDLAVAGLSTAAYGVGVLVLSRLVRVLTRRQPMAVLLAVGGTMMALGFVLVSWRITIVTVLVAALALGGGWAFMHSSLQTWATSVVPEVRGTVVAFFAGSLFLGSSLAAALSASWVDAGRFVAVFAVAGLVAVPLTIAAVLGRTVYERRVGP